MLRLMGQAVPDGALFDLPYLTLSLDEVVTRPGALTITADRDMTEWSQVTLGDTAIYVIDGDQIEWAGIVWTDSFDGDRLTVQAEGLFSYFRPTAGRDRLYRGGIDGMTAAAGSTSSTEHEPNSPNGDCTESSGVVTGADDNLVAAFGGSAFWVGLRFTGIPKYPTAIQSATLTLHIADTATDSPNGAVIDGEDTDFAPRLKATTNNISSRTGTTATVTWTGTNIGTGDHDIDVTAIIDEIHTRPGFVDDGAILLRVHGHASGALAFDASNKSAGSPPLLTIFYENGGATWTAAEQYDIVEDLIGWVQAQDQSDIGLTVARHPSDSGVDRTYTIEPWERRSVGDEIETLAEALGGFEMRVTSTWENNQPTNQLELWSPRYGTDTGKVWWHGAQIRIDARDRTAVANKVDATGTGSGAARLIESAESTPARLRHDRAVSYGDIDNASILDALASAELAALPGQADVLRAEVLDDPDGWQVGDTVAVVANDGWLQVNATYRIVGRQRRVDEARSLTDSVDLVVGEPTGRAAVLRRHALSRYLRHIARRTNRLEGR